jgi:spectinomycin phosphotransferase
MLEKPDLPDEKIAACLQKEYGLTAVQLTFLPLGADVNTAVYRVTTSDESPYFLKLRRDNFDEMSVALPKFLSDQGIQHIIPTLTTQTGRLWAALNPFKVILYPFVDGSDGYQVDLSDDQWAEFGAALKRIHTADLPPAITNHIRQESYPPHWRESVRGFLELVEGDVLDEPVALEAAALLKAKRGQIL